MILQAIFFYLFAAVCIASAFMVVAGRNPVHSVLFLILAFVNAAGLFVLLGAEFLAMILIVVYVGAVAVLFLFVVMMLDVDFVELRHGVLNYLPVGAAVGIVLLIELVFGVIGWVIAPGLTKTITAPISSDINNTQALGLVLYTRYRRTDDGFTSTWRWRATRTCGGSGGTRALRKEIRSRSPLAPPKRRVWRSRRTGNR